MTNMMGDEEKNKALLLRLIEEGFNKGELSVVDEVVAVASKEHQRGNSDGARGQRK